MKTSNVKTKAYAFRGGAALITVATLILALLFTACPNAAGGSGSGGNSGGGGTPVPPAGSFEDTGDGFIKIIPPAAGIVGMDPAYTVPGPGNSSKGVFVAGRKVKLSPYKLCKTEVTYKLWKEVYNWAVKPENGYTFANPGVKGKDGSGSEDDPVTKVNWRDCIIWCNAYTEKEKGIGECIYRKNDDYTVVLKNATATADCNAAYADMSKKGYRLPTEAEWEYAARWQGSDGTNADNCGDVQLTKLNSASGAKDKWDTAETGEVAWYRDNGGGKTHPVGKKRANALGLHDMSGNVYEWCFDWYKLNPTANDSAYTSGEFVTDPQGAALDSYRIKRGGGWNDVAMYCIVGSRSGSQPGDSENEIGFRLASRPESGGGTPTPAYVRVPYTKLAGYLNTASATDLHYIEVTGVTNNDLNGSGPNPSLLGQIIKGSGKRVALKLPAEITEIKLIAFKCCTGLERVDLSACTGLTKIDDSAFRECTDLKRVNLSGCAVLSEIGADAFRDCGGLTQVDLSGCTGPITIGNLAFANCPIETLAIDCAVTGTIITKLTQEVSVKANLKNLKLGAGVTKIGANAFEECKALKSVNLADHASLTDIGESAFAECTALESIDLSDCTSLTQIDEGTFAGCSLLPSVDLSGCTSLATIGITAFSGCTALKSIDLSGCTNLTAINDDAFENCSLLPSVDLSGCTSLATIGDTVFSGCTKAVIKLPESIVTIGDSAFGSAEASWCKKVLIKSGAEYDRIKGLVTGLGYPADRIGSY